MEVPGGLRLSLDKAYKFMKDDRNPHGLWSDFLTLAGESVYWVTGYVGYILDRYARAPGEGWLEKLGSIDRSSKQE